MTKILLVEDDPLIYRMYQKAFDHEGFTTELAENGQEGLDKLQSFHPDIILLDIMMPKMNGVEMLAKLRENPDTKDTPVVVLTNVSEQAIDNEVFDKGANLLLIKSETDPTEVIGWMNSVLGKSGYPIEPKAPKAEESARTETPAPLPAEAPAGEPTPLSTDASAQVETDIEPPAPAELITEGSQEVTVPDPDETPTPTPTPPAPTQQP